MMQRMTYNLYVGVLNELVIIIVRLHYVAPHMDSVLKKSMNPGQCGADPPAGVSIQRVSLLTVV